MIIRALDSYQWLTFWRVTNVINNNNNNNNNNTGACVNLVLLTYLPSVFINEGKDIMLSDLASHQFSPLTPFTVEQLNSPMKVTPLFFSWSGLRMKKKDGTPKKKNHKKRIKLRKFCKNFCANLWTNVVFQTQILKSEIPFHIYKAGYQCLAQWLK